MDGALHEFPGDQPHLLGTVTPDGELRGAPQVAKHSTLEHLFEEKQALHVPGTGWNTLQRGRETSPDENRTENGQVPEMSRFDSLGPWLNTWCMKVVLPTS